MKSLIRSEQVALMNKALGFFFSDPDVVLFIDFDSSMNLSRHELELALAYYSVIEVYEHWNVETLCNEIINLYSLLTSVYGAKNEGGGLC